LGAALLAGVYALALAMGWLTVTDTFVRPPVQPFVAAILADVLLVVGIACWEQTVFRGYLIKNVAEGLTGSFLSARWAAVIAVLLPAIAFGLGHANNPDATMVSTVNTMIFGVLFGAAYVLTGELALALGLHFAWDFVQGFGFGRSGDATNLGAFLVTGEGDPAARLWTGWPYTVEGGLLGTVAFVLGFVLIAGWARFRRGSLRLPSKLAQPPIQVLAG
jgi:membrane protease YdiL (CAAX protease family)